MPTTSRYVNICSAPISTDMTYTIQNGEPTVVSIAPIENSTTADVPVVAPTAWTQLVSVLTFQKCSCS